MQEQKVSFISGTKDSSLIKDETLADIFRASAKISGKRILFRSENREITWEEVDRITESAALKLISLGAAPGKSIGLFFQRGVDLLLAQIAIVKTGAAFLPFDGDAPVDRIISCLKDAESIGCISDDAGVAKINDSSEFNLPLWESANILKIDDNQNELLNNPNIVSAKPDDVAYLIYTSGTTGIPKGIAITNRNICHFLRAANEIYKITSDDIVFQGASVAFDLSMEEIWVPYFAGASLYVATPQIMADIEGLPALLKRENVSVLDTVPTLLSAFSADIPTIRLILLGGEALSPSLVDRWSKSGRKIYNTYGPTEATVVATVSEVKAGEAVTIGCPISNYTCYVVDENLKILPIGQEGELLIGGPGIAKGYLARPELTQEKFIQNPFIKNGDDPILYRSGDAVLINENGEIVFRGRIDDQIKIRGFRVELGEIENHLVTIDVIAQAAVVARSEQGIDRLVAFMVIAESFSLPSTTELRQRLQKFLPTYMIPDQFEIIDEIPRLISGKTDRKTLKTIKLKEVAISEEEEKPQTETESLLLKAARKVFPGRPINFDADFFLDLGGHSLIAAQFVSIVRETRSFSKITLQDMYSLRSLRKIAAMLDERFGNSYKKDADISFVPPPFYRRFFCGVAQALAMPLILAISTLQWLGVFITYMFLGEAELTLLQTVATLSFTYIIIKFGTLFFVVGLKWIILGRTKPGRYPLWGVYFFRWWFVQRLFALANPGYFANSPIMPLYLRLLGAKVGSNVMIAHAQFGAVDLVTIGDWVSIGHKANLANAEVIAGELIIDKITLEDDVYIGNQTMITSGCIIGKNAHIEDMTCLPPDIKVGDYEIWEGSPARKTGNVNPNELKEKSLPSKMWNYSQYWVYAFLVIIFSAIGLIPLFPAFYVFDHVESLLIDNLTYLEWYDVLPIVSWVMGAALIVFTLAFVVAIRWIILPKRLKEGTYSVHSWLYLRQWMMNLATEVSLDTLSSLYATIYMQFWYRLMGCKIGKGAEISTNIGARYDLISIGESAFIADECLLGDEDNYRGWVTFRNTNIGRRVFVGNNAVVAHGTELKEGALVGVKSLIKEGTVVNEQETWFGSPAISFPVRQKFGDISSTKTFSPPFHMKLCRALFEAFHVTFPTMLFITLGSIAVYFFIYPAWENDNLDEAFYWFVASSIIMPIITALIVCAIKWILMGRFKPTSYPMWSWGAFKSEAIAVLYWGLAGRVLLEHLRGTPFLPMVLRLFGMKIGKGVYLDTVDTTEFDCITIDDYVMMNDFSCLQTHLYEDRLMKIGFIYVGKGASLGTFTTVLYDTELGEFAQLQPLTLVMKGEKIPPNTIWGGVPAQPFN